MKFLRAFELFGKMFLLFGVLTCSEAKSRKDKLKKSTKIVGGRFALKSEVPYIVALIKETKQYCGGAIVNEKFIVTAAHCFEDYEESYYLSNVKVIAGTLDITERDNAQVIGLKDITVHENYDGETFDNDIALLELQTPLKFNNEVQPIPIPPQGIPSTGKAKLSGWGVTKLRKEYDRSGKKSEKLKTVDVEIVPRKECDKIYTNASNKEVYHGEKSDRNAGLDPITRTGICAGVMPDGGKDACQADSGGPLQCSRKDESGNVEKYLCGVVSSGLGCGLKLPGAFTEVAQFSDWIMQHTEKF